MDYRAVEEFVKSMNTDDTGFHHFIRFREQARENDWDQDTKRAILERIKDKYTNN